MRGDRVFKMQIHSDIQNFKYNEGSALGSLPDIGGTSSSMQS